MQCSVCQSEISYDDCQKNITVESCDPGQTNCQQTEIQLEHKSDPKIILFSKGCLGSSVCEDYRKGQVGQCTSFKERGYTGTCTGKCCTEDNCNKGNLLASKASAFVMSVMVLLSGIVLTAIHFN